MYKEIIECQSISDRIEKILGFVRDENQNPVQSFASKNILFLIQSIFFCFYFTATKSSEAFNTSGDNNFQRSLVVPSTTLFNNEENEMTSANWLKILE